MNNTYDVLALNIPVYIGIWKAICLLSMRASHTVVSLAACSQKVLKWAPMDMSLFYISTQQSPLCPVHYTKNMASLAIQ